MIFFAISYFSLYILKKILYYNIKYTKFRIEEEKVVEREKIIKDLVKKEGLSLKNFAKKAGIPYTTFYSILERGIGNASVNNVIKICKTLGIAVEDLDTMVDDQKENKFKILNKKIFSERLSNLMSEHNETVYSIGEIVHLSAATISRYKNAEMAPKITTIEVLARHFGINPKWLLGYDVPKKLDSNSEQKQNKPHTIAAHLEGEGLTEEEMKDLKKYIDFLLSKRKK